jgi:hypothetical protein
MFEISASVYAKEHGISLKRKGGKSDKNLIGILKDVKNHLTDNEKNKDFLKILHGAIVEMDKAEGVLSVTSMNQLVHNNNFATSAKEISMVFSRIYPLLEAMN